MGQKRAVYSKTVWRLVEVNLSGLGSKVSREHSIWVDGFIPEYYDKLPGSF
jgi:hypothetical protein